MLTCSQCGTQANDDITVCPTCQASFHLFSTAAIALNNMRKNPRVTAIRISVGDDACPACQNHQAVYSKENVPQLPMKGCSHPNGCRCFYDPILSEIYP